MMYLKIKEESNQYEIDVEFLFDMVASEWNMTDEQVLNLPFSIWRRKVKSWIKKARGFDGLVEKAEKRGEFDLTKRNSIEQLKKSGLFKVKKNEASN